MSVAILRGDARSLPLPDESVDLIVTSPPYFGQRDYRDNGQSLEGQIGAEATPREYVAALLDCTREWARVLKPSGSIFVNLGDKYSQRVAARKSSHQDGLFPDRPDLVKDWKRDRAAGLARMPRENVISADGGWVREKSLMGLPWRYAIGCADDLGLILRRDIIWRKLSHLPESVADRCATSHEYLFHLAKQRRYYSAIDEIREPHEMRPQRRPNGHKTRQEFGVLPAQTFSTSQRDELGIDGHPLGKLPGSVWEIPSQPLVVPERVAHGRCCGGKARPGCKRGLDHFAAFPFELPRRCILGWSPPGICLACGEGRRTVALREQEWTGRVNSGRAKRQLADGIGLSRGHNAAGYPHTRSVTSISGYACACTPYTDHEASEARSNRRDRAPESTRPHGDYARKQAGEYERVGPWREYHLDRWVAPPARPAVVLDPFMGTGTTLLMADVLGRDAIGIDRSNDYCRLARWRTTDPGERARAMRVPKPPVVPDGQDSLFDLDGEAAS